MFSHKRLGEEERNKFYLVKLIDGQADLQKMNWVNNQNISMPIKRLKKTLKEAKSRKSGFRDTMDLSEERMQFQENFHLVVDSRDFQ